MAIFEEAKWTTDAARLVLAAWPYCEKAPGQAELDQAAKLCLLPALNPIEAERRDLLAGIVGKLRELRNAPSSASQTASKQACLRLLMHLTKEHARPASFFPAGPLPQSETHAYSLH